MQWFEIIISIPVLLFSLSFHEAAHAWMADRRGDDTARLAGRLTLNPIPHIDLFGTILLPALLIISQAGFIIGAAKPVPVDVRNLRDPKWDRLYVSLVGPGSNIILALIFTLALQAAYLFGVDPWSYGQMNASGIFLTLLHFGVLLNLILAGFNILPVPPLDGSSILLTFLPPRAAMFVARYSQFGFLLIILLIFTGVLRPYFNIFYWLYAYLSTPFF
ncbi:MAG: site-2 protease family protein [Candidatus Coatesbacteria bacterium]|jgi:Zn-dependent protease|nr:site-2 protease family protein [Candidatus Coatesbacteria bacterium]